RGTAGRRRRSAGTPPPRRAAPPGRGARWEAGGAGPRPPTPPAALSAPEELLADPVRAVPDVGFQEAGLLGQLELEDEAVDLLVREPVEHLHRLAVGVLDDVARQLGHLRHDLDRPALVLVPDVDRILLGVVQILREGRVLLDERRIHEIADVDRVA